jgi:hypothetical protein
MSLPGVRISGGPLRRMFDNPASTGLEPDERLHERERSVLRHADDRVLPLA